MDVSVTLKLFMTDTQKNAFKETMRAFNSACSVIAEKYGDETNRIRLHHKAYDETRSSTGLSSQFVVRAIGRVADANKTRVVQTKSKKLRRRVGKCRKPVVFRECASVPYDARLSDFSKLWSRGEVSLSTCAFNGKRETVGVSLHPHSATMLLSGNVRAGSLLSYRPRDDEFYLTLVVELPDAEEITPCGVVGVDMGVVNIATLSDGANYSSESVERVRARFAKVRKELQERGTSSARKRLKKIGGREARYRRDVNHRISKRIVVNAKGTKCAVAIEELSGINARTTVRTSERSRRFGWSFAQLRFFIEYKAKRAGVTVIAINPAYTSQTCPYCGHVDRGNRPSRDTFECLRCGFSGPADHVAAMNIRNAGLESLSLGAGQCARNATPFSDASVSEGTIGGLSPEDVGTTSGSCKPATLVVGN